MIRELNGIKGAFLNGIFSQGEKLYMYVPQGFEKFYLSNMVLLLEGGLKGIHPHNEKFFQIQLSDP